MIRVKKNDTVWNNIGQVQTIVSLIILLQCAKNITQGENSSSLTIIFDNLDVITNPAIPAENVILLWGVMDHFIKFRENYYNNRKKRLINVKMIIVVRKVLYSHIISNLPDLEMLANFVPDNINICDISKLYLSQEILKHRILFWEHKINDDKINDKFERLRDITSVHSCENLQEYEKKENDFAVKTTIDLDAFFNHNYRAFSNILATFVDNSKYYKILMRDLDILHENSNWKRVSTQVFLISLLYRKEKVWNTMGFGCKDFDTIDYPTTLNRLILNYLFISKIGHHLGQLGINRSDIPIDDFVSLKNCTDLFSKAKFITIKTSYNQNKINEKYIESTLKTQDLILERLSDMCARNPMSNNLKASGYDSDDDELWRRPLYFVGGVKLKHTATSKDELKEYFEKAINNNESDKIKFSITDEGFILIRDIVADFEFYSARYCDERLLKPLHQSISAVEIDRLIEPVYDAIRTCCERNDVFRKQYSETYKIDTNNYLKKNFHTRTNPRYIIKQGVKKLQENTFREQLHIVRVIYNHCDYFDTVKEYFFNSDNPEKNKMCESLTKWIELYLDLYKTHFFSVLENTVCHSDNNIYEELYTLVREQKRHYVEGSDFKNININRMGVSKKKRLN